MTSWRKYSDEQLKFVFLLLVENFSAPEIKPICLIRWNNLRIVGECAVLDKLPTLIQSFQPITKDRWRLSSLSTHFRPGL